MKLQSSRRFVSSSKHLYSVMVMTLTTLVQVIKSVSMKDGPRPRQLALVAAIWLFSLLLGLERMLVLQMQDRATTSRSAGAGRT